MGEVAESVTTSGSCNCGKVAFDIATGENTRLTDVYVCHCSICRKSTGSAGIAVAVVDADCVSWTQGQDKVQTWHKPGHDWVTSFCRDCGSPLPGKNDDTTCYVPVSLLDTGHEALEVKHHIWVGSKAVWEAIAGNGKQHLERFNDEQ